MKIYLKHVLIIIFTGLFFTCKEDIVSKKLKLEQRQKVEIVTNYGTMIFELYDETPLHRNNFKNLIQNGAYDSLLFHRVINKFVIQAGDPDSRNAKLNDTLGDGDAPYLVDAEFKSELFHKKGALGAARDDNPTKASSAMQFYVVQGSIFNDSLLDLAQMRINKNKAYDYFKGESLKIPLLDSIQKALELKDRKGYATLMDSIYKKAMTKDAFSPHTIREEQREVYKSLGGTPHLDQGYTVFGELVEGVDVLDAIAIVETSPLDRPLNNVTIVTMRLIE